MPKLVQKATTDDLGESVKDMHVACKPTISGQEASSKGKERVSFGTNMTR
jgi:hypothetical protein